MEIEIHTDGGCHGNPGPGGWAYVITSAGEVIAEKWGGEKLTTNNKMELSAAIFALKAAGELDAEKITLWTDSEYVKNGITLWINGWKKNGWKTAGKKPVKNVDLWHLLDETQSKLPVTWKWVRGHNGEPLNERCDKLTQIAIESIQ